MEKECILTEKQGINQKKDMLYKEIVDEDDTIMKEININQPIRVIMDGTVYKYINSSISSKVAIGTANS
jgi:hypothetical protein